jgi:glycosyltransferase involved in cell wall biosynthesis
VTAGRPRFSVVVPALDEAENLPRTLASLAAQDFGGDVEVIVVDNGSRDATGRLARAAGARVVVERQRGVCAARQAGTDASRGEVVVSTDADTVHPPDWLSRIDRQLRRHPNAVAVAGPCIYAEPPWWGRVVTPVWFAGIGALYAVTGRVAYLTATNVAFRRDGFPGYDTQLTQGGDEVDLLRRLRDRGPVVWEADNPVVTSARRLDQGLAYTVLVSYGYYYVVGPALARLGGGLHAPTAPAVRVSDRGFVRRRRRRWRLASVGLLLTATALGVRSRLRPRP